MMTESEIQVFIDGVKHYFLTVSDSKAVVGTPYIMNDDAILCSDYMGVINVSGARHGKVYVLAARAMLRHLLLGLGEKYVTPELLVDIVGEVANTISGSVREQFGSQFVISVPTVQHGDGHSFPSDVRAFNVPFRWKSYAGHLVVSLK